MNIPRIRMGLEFVDDSADGVCVSGINESNGIVPLDMLDTWSRCRFGPLIRHHKRKVGSGIERYLYDRPEAADHGDGAGRRLCDCDWPRISPGHCTVGGYRPL